MTLRFPILSRSTLLPLLMTLGLLVTAAEASEPIVIESSTWSTTGTMKVRVDSVKEELEVLVTLEFGPNVDLLPGQFRLTVDDGADPFSFVGVYEETTPGKPTFPDLGDAVAEALELAPDLPDLQLSSKIKARPKLNDGVETVRVAFKIKVKLSVDGEPMSIAVAYKGEGGRVE